MLIVSRKILMTGVVSFLFGWFSQMSIVGHLRFTRNNDIIRTAAKRRSRKNSNPSMNGAYRTKGFFMNNTQKLYKVSYQEDMDLWKPEEKFCWEHQDFGLIFEWRKQQAAHLKQCSSTVPNKTYFSCRILPRHLQKRLPKIGNLCELANFIVNADVTTPQVFVGKHCSGINGILSLDARRLEPFPSNIKRHTDQIYFIPPNTLTSENIFHGLDIVLNTFLALQVGGVNLLRNRPLIVWPNMATKSVYKSMLASAFGRGNKIHHDFRGALQSNGHTGKVLVQKMLIHSQWPGSMALVHGDSICHNSKFFTAFSRIVLHGLNFLEVNGNAVPKILFSVRRRTASRNVGRIFGNEEEIYEMLIHGGASADVVRADFATIPLVQQIELVHRSNIYIGAHGAGLTWVIFMPPESILIEILPFHRTDQHFRNLARLSGTRYIPFNQNRISCQGKSSNIWVDIEAFKPIVDVAVRIIRAVMMGKPYCGLDAACMIRSRDLPIPQSPCEKEKISSFFNFLPPVNPKITLHRSRKASVAFENAVVLDTLFPKFDTAIVLGARGASCSNTCVALFHGAKCESKDLRAINSCKVLNTIAKQLNESCNACKILSGTDHPSIVLRDMHSLRDASFSSNIGVCIVGSKPQALGCSGQHIHTRRFCTCRGSTSRLKHASDKAVIQITHEKHKQFFEPPKQTAFSKTPSRLAEPLVIAISVSNRSTICQVLESIRKFSPILQKPQCINKTRILLMFLGSEFTCPTDFEHPCIIRFHSNINNVNILDTTSRGRNQIIDKRHQKQTLHFVQLIEHAHKILSEGFVMLLDDDSVWCPNLYKILESHLKKRTFLFMHLGQGSSGIVIPRDKLLGVKTYLQKNIDKSNVDILIMLWAEKTSQCRLASRKRLMLHKGITSTFGKQWRDDNACSDDMKNHRLFLQFPQTMDDDFHSANCHTKRF